MTALRRTGKNFENFPVEHESRTKQGGRIVKQKEIQALKDSSQKLINSAGGVESSAMFCRVQKTSLGRYQSSADLASYMPIDVVRCLERTSGTVLVTRTLANLMGYELFKLPTPVGEERISKQLNRAFKESGDLLVEGAKALEDERVDASEAADVLQETREAIIALVQLQHLLEARIAGESRQVVA
jgi:hypothetical protein